VRTCLDTDIHECGHWGFSNYEFTVQIPYFPRGGDYVIVAYDPADKTNNRIIYEHILELRDEYHRDNLRVTSGWPNCLPEDGCHYWLRDLDGFNSFAAQANDVQTGYTIGQFSTDISGWGEAHIGVLKADCTDSSDYSTCTNFDPVTTNWAGLAADWTLRAAHIEHTDTEVTIHFALTVYEFAREGSYFIYAYDSTNDANSVVYPTVVQLQDLGQYGYNFVDASYHNPVCDDYCSGLFSDDNSVRTEYAFRLLQKQYARWTTEIGVAYPGEAVYGQFSASEATNFDDRFGVSFALVPGVCQGLDSQLDCTWNDGSQL
jgi:hypothetical protein